MVFEVKRISDMNRAEYNPRINLLPSDEEFEKLKDCIQKYGMVLPIIWNKRTNNVVGGHQRLTVEEYLGHKEVTVSVVDLDEVKEKQLNIALNKISGQWDDKKLIEIINELDETVLATGFSLAEIEALEASIEDKVDTDMINAELETIDQTFNVTLCFKTKDRPCMERYIDEFGRDSVAALIVGILKGGT